jgi:YqaJ-like viral recombinase domain
MLFSSGSKNLEARLKAHNNIQQNSVDWLILRSGKITASEIDALVSPLGKVKTGDGPHTYLTQKLAEVWLGGPLPSVQGVMDLDNGRIMEEYAKPAFTVETGLELEDIGFITADNEMLGCSPDGKIKGQDVGLEAKCPRVENHIKYLLSGRVPKDYVLQCQFSLYVTGWKKWYFYSYRSGFPSLIVEVGPDEAIQEAICEAVANFECAFHDGLEKLVKLNGGLPKATQRGNAPFPYQPKPSPEPTNHPETSENCDLMP